MRITIGLCLLCFRRQLSCFNRHDTMRHLNASNFSIKLCVEKLLGEKDAISENNRSLYTIWEFKVFSFIWKKAFQLFPCVPSSRI